MDHQVLSRHVDVKALEVDILDLAVSGELNLGVPHFESLKPAAELLGQLVFLDTIPPQPSALVLLKVQLHEQQLALTPVALAKSVVEAPLGSRHHNIRPCHHHTQPHTRHHIPRLLPLVSILGPETHFA